jgi:hypothetical protein
MKTLIIWLFVVTGPNNVQVEAVEYTTKEECQIAVDNHLRMGLSEYRAECRKRHRTEFDPPFKG